MALPVTITGISTAVACVGPYKSSGGNFYFFGRDGTTATTLQAYKSTAPDTSWSSIATNTGFSTNIRVISGFQVGDVIHLALVDESAGPVGNLKYRTFDMSSDSFILSETVQSGYDVRTSGSSSSYSASIVVRSGGEVVIHYNGARVANMGNSYAQTYFSRRTGVNTWSAATQVSAGGTVDYIRSEAILGVSDAVHLVHSNFATTAMVQRTLSSANALQTAASFPSIVGLSGGDVIQYQGVSYNNAGTTKVAVTGGNTITPARVVGYFDSGNTPTLNVSSSLGSPGGARRLFVDGTDIWELLDGGATQLFVQKSTDNGATFGSATVAYTGTSFSGTPISIDSGTTYTRGSDRVIAYIVNDNGTLKYNEYVVFTSGTAHQGAGAFAGAGALTAAALKLLGLQTFAGAGALTAGTIQQMQAAVQFAGAGSLTVPANLLANARVTWAGAGAMLPAETMRLLAFANFAGAGALTASALKVINALTFAGAGNMSIATRQLMDADLFAAGTGAMTASALKLLGAQTFAGSGALNDNIKQRMATLAPFAGSGLLAVDVTPAAGAQQASALFAGTGAMSAQALKLLGVLTFAGTGGLSATAAQRVVTTATFAGAGSMTAAALKLLGLQTFAGTGNLTANTRQLMDADFFGAGAGSLTDAVKQRMVAAVGWAGAGAMVANATPGSSLQQIAAAFAGTGALVATALKLAFPATLAGAGGLSATAALRMAALAAFAGAGSLTVSERQRMAVATGLAGAGALFADANKLGAGIPLSAAWAGAGSMSGSASMLLRAVPSVFAGAGSLTAAAAVALRATAAWAGAGGFAAVGRMRMVSAADMAAAGTFTIASRQILRAANDEFGGAGSMGIDSNQRAVVAMEGGGLGLMIVRAIVLPAMILDVENTLARALPRLRTLVHEEGRVRDLQPGRYRVREVTRR